MHHQSQGPLGVPCNAVQLSELCHDEVEQPHHCFYRA